MMNNTMMNATVNATESNTVENKEVTMNAMEMYEKKMAEMQAELLERAFPEISTTTTSMSAKGIVQAFKSGKMESGNTVQRTDVWKAEQRDLFIHSILTGFPIPQIISLRSEVVGKNDKMVMLDDLIDGKYLLAQKGKKNYYLLIVK